MKQTITKQQILNAMCVKKNLPLKLSEIERNAAKTLLAKRLTISEALDIVDMMTYPYNAEMKNVSGRLSVANMVLDKVAKKLGVTEKDLDKMYADSKEEFAKANQEAIKEAKEALSGKKGKKVTKKEKGDK